jgi:hypothetical protein
MKTGCEIPFSLRLFQELNLPQLGILVKGLKALFKTQYLDEEPYRNKDVETELMDQTRIMYLSSSTNDKLSGENCIQKALKNQLISMGLPTITNYLWSHSIKIFRWQIRKMTKNPNFRELPDKRRSRMGVQNDEDKNIPGYEFLRLHLRCQKTIRHQGQRVYFNNPFGKVQNDQKDIRLYFHFLSSHMKS